MTETLVDVWVPGKARPKGSMRPIGNGRMVESNEASPEWRAQLARAFWRDYHERELSNQDSVQPWGRPVDVAVAAYFNRRGATSVCPDSVATGDVDKLLRNVLDALQGPRKGVRGVLADDALVQHGVIDPFWVRDDLPEGMWVIVTAPTDEELAFRARVANVGLDRMLARRGLLSPTGY